MWCWGLSSGPHACMGSSVPTEPSLQPPDPFPSSAFCHLSNCSFRLTCISFTLSYLSSPPAPRLSGREPGCRQGAYSAAVVLKMQHSSAMPAFVRMLRVSEPPWKGLLQMNEELKEGCGYHLRVPTCQYKSDDCMSVIWQSSSYLSGKEFKGSL